MPLLQSCDPGTEYLVPWAKNKLRIWHADMLRDKIPYISRVVYTDVGVSVRITALSLGNGDFRDTIRATGGSLAYVATDPFFPLWSGIDSVMPATRPGVLPALTWTPVVQHVSAYYPTGTGEYLRRHWLVICRYCKRVAEYTWDETAVHVTIPATDDVAEHTVRAFTQAYVSHTNTALVTRDTAADGTTTDHTTTLTLVAESDANTYGWITGASSIHPGPPPAYPDTVIPERPASTGSVTQTVYPDGTLGPPNGFPDIRFVVTGYVINDNTSIVSPGTWDSYGQAGSFPPSELDVAWINIQTAAAAENSARAAAYAAAQLAWYSTAVAAAVALYQSIASLMSAKRFGVASELAELRPYDDALYHKHLNNVYVAVPVNVAHLTATYDSTHTQDFAYTSAHAAPLPTSVYNVAFALTTPASPALPDTPWAATVTSLDAYTYTSSSKSFARAAAVPLVNAYFSRATTPPLVLGSDAPVAFTGFYLFIGDDDAGAAFEDGVGRVRTVAEVDAAMKAACISTAAGRVDLGYVVYQAIKGTAGREYRRTAHAQAVGPYTFAQPAIP